MAIFDEKRARSAIAWLTGIAMVGIICAVWVLATWLF